MFALYYLCESVQWPIFLYTAFTIRRMAYADWPGFSDGGALWFKDLTLSALVLQPDGSLLLPMGAPGLLLPLGVTALMLLSIRIGFKASGRVWGDKRGSPVSKLF
jgi:hypothetical protein